MEQKHYGRGVNLKTKLVRLNLDLVDALDELKNQERDVKLSYNDVIRRILSTTKEYEWYRLFREFLDNPNSYTRQDAVENLLKKLDQYWKKHYNYGGRKHPLEQKQKL